VELEGQRRLHIGWILLFVSCVVFLQAAGAEGACCSGGRRFVRAGSVSEYEPATPNFNMVLSDVREKRRPPKKSMSNISKRLDIVMEHGCNAGSTAASDDGSLLQPQKVLKSA
jgi:hypothetical protein